MAHSYDINMSLPIGASEEDSAEMLNQLAEEQFVDLVQAREGLITFALDLRWTDRQQVHAAGFA